MESKLQLYINTELLGDLLVKEFNQPFIFCNFIPTPLFIEKYTSVFEKMLKYLNKDEIEKLSLEQGKLLSKGLVLKDNGSIIDDFIINIDLDKNEAWFRY